MAADPRSWLFVPGDSTKKLEKIAGCGADAVIIDLEDSVALANKDQARELTHAFVAGFAAVAGAPALWVRVNPLDSPFVLQDVDAAVSAGVRGIVLPKAEGPGSVEQLAAMIDRFAGDRSSKLDIAIHAIATETARAVLKLHQFADHVPGRLAALSWGAEDLSSALGASSNRAASGQYSDAFRHARTMTLFAAHAAGVQAVEGLHADYRDLEGLRASCAAARRDGFTGRLAIHPAQVAVINDMFMPTGEERAWAERIITAFADAPGAGTIGLDGKMVDRPHLLQAQKLIARYRSYSD